jgi:hypothetical protein
MFPHTASAFHKCPIHSLSETIELRHVTWSESLQNTRGLAVRRKLGVLVLTAIVTSQNLDRLVELGLDHTGKLHKLVVHFRLLAQQVHPTIRRSSTDECQEVHFAKRWSLHGTTDIRADLFGDGLAAMKRT